MVKSGEQNQYSSQETHQVCQVGFSVMSEREIIANSVCEVFEKRIYDYETMEPVEGGLNDPRMGVSNLNKNCQTCEENSIECPGHFGHIKLAKPVYHKGYIEYVKKILTCVCKNCSKLLIDKNNPDNISELERIKNIKNGITRLREMVKLCEKINICKMNMEKMENNENNNDNYNQNEDYEDSKYMLKNNGCGSIQPKYQLKQLQIKIDPKNEDDEENERVLYAHESIATLKKISDEDCFLLGLNPESTRPENLIITVLPVGPPSIRPSIQMDAISRSEDDLTHQYLQILKINDNIKALENKNATSNILEKQIDYLQIQVACLFDNELNGISKACLKSGKAIKSIRERIKGKQGRLRQHLMGKRVDFSARTVVSPDPNLDLDQLGVPRSMALNLTIPETVTSLNMDRLKELVINGPSQWPGAKTIKRTDGKVFDLRFTKNREEIQLNPGYVIERHLQDGDFVIFNRQPSLHRMSMMGHRIKILPFSSFRLNLSVTTPYNADFDGDEMNMHVPQTYETKAEVKYIMHVSNQIVAPQANKPCMGIVQDSLVGIRLLTRRDTFLNKDQIMNLLLWIDDWDGNLPPPAIFKPEKLWTGKQVISLILPEVNLEKKCSVAGNYDDYQLNLRDQKIIIEKGELLTGMLDKGVVGNANGGVIHYIWLDYNPHRAAKFLSNAQKIVNNWFVNFGFSVGVSDIFPSKEVQDKIIKELNRADSIVNQRLDEAMNEKLDSQPGKGIFEKFEASVNKDLNELFQTASSQATNIMNDSNRIYCMVASGSKGSNLNISQIMAIVGQQNVEGKRIPFGFRSRTLPHFTKDDYGPSSRGFVLNSFLTGLTPSEFFFHAMGGREGIIDTAVKTSETGYVQRKLTKALEDVMVKYDSTVRDASANIIQFIYGEDGNSGEYIENCFHNFHELNNQQFINQFRFIDDSNYDRDISDQLADYENQFEPEIIKSLLNNSQNLMDAFKMEYSHLLKAQQDLREIFPSLDNKVYLPVNIPRLIKNVKSKHQQVYNQKCNFSPLEVITKVEELIERIINLKGKDELAKQVQRNSSYLLVIMIRFYLSSKRVCLKEKMNLEMLEMIIGDIESKYVEAQAHPGEMVGVICAQSLGEPTTQMTLNTFHFAGVSSKNVTLGVPRLKEILGVATNIKTPSLIIYLKDHFSGDKEFVDNKSLDLEYTTVGQLTKSSMIYYDRDPSTTVIKEDQDMVQRYQDMPDVDDPLDNSELSSWMLRIELNRDDVLNKAIFLQQIRDQIKKQINQNKDESQSIKLQIHYTPDNYPTNYVLRIRLISTTTTSEEQLDLLKSLEHYILNKIGIKGIQNIKKVFTKKSKKKYIDQDGEIKQKDEYVIETDGTNLKKVLELDEVDCNRTYSNHNKEIFEVLGIEAARQSLLKEIRVILDAYNIYVNYRHLTTLCDLMTTRGQLTSISRHGINRVVDGPFRRATFEESVEILFGAAVFSEQQKFKGLSENIMFGQLTPQGTGCFDILLNVAQNEKQVYIPDNELHIDIRDNIHIIEEQEANLIMNTPDIMNQGQTPIISRTPNIYEMNSNLMNYNNMNSMYNNMMGQFTPQTPGPETRTQIYSSLMSNKLNDINSQVNSQPPLQFFNTKSLAYDSFKTKSPVYSPNGSNDMGMSPQDSSQQMPFSPTNTNSRFNAQSISPSYNQGSQQLHRRMYTPASPGYQQNLVNSPSYSQNQSNSNPSPAYSGTPLLSINNTPSSGFQSSALINSQPNSNNLYSPTSHTNNRQYLPTNIYNPTSPAYNPTNQYLNNVIYSENEDDEEDDDDDDDHNHNDYSEHHQTHNKKNNFDEDEDDDDK